MRPVIGISSSFDWEDSKYYLRQTYVESVVNGGGVPLVIPAVDDTSVIGEYIGVCDGFILSGGGDLDPVYWGSEPHPRLGEIDPVRDSFEMVLTRKILEENKPALFICRGIQVLNVAAGGDLIQNIRSDILHRQKAPRYHPVHDVVIERGSMLHLLAERNLVRVNSFHHQVVGRVGQGLKVTATARDGLIEAVEYPECDFVVGVQWHPEAMRDLLSVRLFRELVRSSAKQ